MDMSIHSEFLGDPYQVLLVEDDDGIRSLLSQGLIHLGAKVIEAPNADEALKLVGSTQHLDLLCTDIRMEGDMDGLDLATHFSKQDPGLKILLISRHCVNIPWVGRNWDFLAKPFSLAVFQHRIQELLIHGKAFV